MNVDAFGWIAAFTTVAISATSAIGGSGARHAIGAVGAMRAIGALGTFIAICVLKNCIDNFIFIFFSPYLISFPTLNKELLTWEVWVTMATKQFMNNWLYQKYQQES